MAKNTQNTLQAVKILRLVSFMSFLKYNRKIVFCNFYLFLNLGKCVCKPGYTGFTVANKTTCYKYVSASYKTSAADALCKKSGDKLPLPISNAENTNLYNFARSKGLTSAIVLDLNDLKSEGNFLTSRGNKPLWFNWKRGEPDNWRGAEDFAQMRTYDGVEAGKWYDIPGSQMKSVICEQVCTTAPPTTTTKPTTSVCDLAKNCLSNQVVVTCKSYYN